MSNSPYIHAETYFLKVLVSEVIDTFHYKEILHKPNELNPNESILWKDNALGKYQWYKKGN